MKVGSLDVEKVYRGAYLYKKNDTVYSEEIFHVFKNTIDQSILFKSESLTRVDSGEFLKIESSYKMASNWVPMSAKIKKMLGKQIVYEEFLYDKDSQNLLYSFIGDPDETTMDQNYIDLDFINNTIFNEGDTYMKSITRMGVPSRFHISLPSTASAILFFNSKKYDPTSKNRYVTVQSVNNWEYKEKPLPKSIYIISQKLDPESIIVNKTILTATKYTVLIEDDPKKPPPFQTYAYLSKHLAIPYKIEQGDISIEIKYLNDYNKTTNLKQMLAR
jgi:hypothetical protein